MPLKLKLVAFRGAVLRLLNTDLNIFHAVGIQAVVGVLAATDVVYNQRLKSQGCE
jgi:hypothetical protein